MKFLLGTFLTGLMVYLGIYYWMRETSQQVWAQDGNLYVIFPEDRPWLYKAYRPLAYLDGSVTGMRFHIGPH